MWTATEAVVFDKAFDDMPFQWDDIQQIYFPELTVTQIINRYNVVRKHGRRGTEL